MKLTRMMGMAVGLSLLMAGMQAQISLPSVFADHMVLQQDSQLSIWG